MDGRYLLSIIVVLPRYIIDIEISALCFYD
nr:MAG TPA: hypothetical protein [Herelleviridae sp.]DAO29248.1 MAG TPA: hypothetical protein [Caudoviricetes sp.]DAW77266.1 MAG TPA: hypothetical protein [Caudoviricetes sp.]